MDVKNEGSWDFLSEREAVFVDAIARELGGVAWAQPLLADIAKGGGLTGANMARFFELRFGHALHLAGIAPRYEVPGEGESTLDFGFAAGGHNWLTELMRLEETDAVKAATGATIDADGIPWRGMVLSTDAEDLRQSPEGETLKAVQRICQKCERDGHPHKFHEPADELHVLLVDFRTFMHGGDIHDRLHVALGGEFVREECRLFWEGAPISGVFSERTAVRGAPEIRSRVHFLGFVDEKTYEPGAFAAGTQFIANPLLFVNAAAARDAMAAWPLQPARLLNRKG